MRFQDRISQSVESCEIEQKGPRTNTEQCRLPPSIQNVSEAVLQSATGYESGVPSGRNFAPHRIIRYKRESFPVDNQV